MWQGEAKSGRGARRRGDVRDHTKHSPCSGGCRQRHLGTFTQRFNLGHASKLTLMAGDVVHSFNNIYFI